MSVDLVLRPAGVADIPALAHMNRQLIVDEGARNPMTLEELEARFAYLLFEQWTVDLFERDGETVGYALHRYEPNITEPSGREIHLRHFFIVREWRGRGLGRAAFQRLLATRYRPGDGLFLDVLRTNPGGRAFWRGLGLVPYAETMELRVRGG
jgi:GNAT superfamily N-acetyltransferase